MSERKQSKSMKEMSKTDYWECFKCGYRITNIAMQTLKYDLGCPRCKRSLGQFIPKIEEKGDKDETIRN